MLNRTENNSLADFLLLFIILAFTSALYWQTNHFQFVVDDVIVISENKFVQNGINGIPDILTNDSMTGYMGKQPSLLEGGRYRPLSMVLFACVYELFQLNPYFYHLLNWICYLLTGIALYYLLKLLFRDGKQETGRWFPAMALLLFMIHPVHTEVVCNIKGNDEILALFFGLCGWITSLKWGENQKISPLILTWLFLFLSFMAKESSLPLIVAIPLSLMFFRKVPPKKAVGFACLLLIPVVIYFILRYKALGFLFSGEVVKTGIMNDPYFGAGFIPKYSTILFTLLIYLKLLFFPHPLTHDYYPWQIPLQSAGSPGVWTALIVICLLGYLAVSGWNKKQPWTFAILFFFITISLVSNILINVGTLMNERFLFIPSVALPILIIWYMKKFHHSSHPGMKMIAWIVPVLLIPLFGLLTIDRIPDWESNKTIDETDVEVSKNSARANLFAGVTLFNELLTLKDDSVKMRMIKKAKGYNDRALQIYPEYADALKMKTGYASEAWKINKDLPVLLNEFEETMAIKPVPYVEEFVDWLLPRSDKSQMVPFLYRVGYEHLAQGQKNFPEALKYLGKGYQLDRQDAKILFGLSVISYLSGNYKDAASYGEQFLNIHGSNAEILYYTGKSLIMLGVKERGNNYLEQAYQIQPALKSRK
jgi:protein O-mannosyl-transferase